MNAMEQLIAHLNGIPTNQHDYERACQNIAMSDEEQALNEHMKAQDEEYMRANNISPQEMLRSIREIRDLYKRK
jgi:hypothetical protein